MSGLERCTCKRKCGDKCKCRIKNQNCIKYCKCVCVDKDCDANNHLSIGMQLE